MLRDNKMRWPNRFWRLGASCKLGDFVCNYQAVGRFGMILV